MNIAATSLPATPVPMGTEPPLQIVGFSDDGTQAIYADAFGTTAPLLVTMAPTGGKRKMSTLEILLIAVAVAIGVVTLCVLISVSKK